MSQIPTVKKWIQIYEILKPKILENKEAILLQKNCKYCGDLQLTIVVTLPYFRSSVGRITEKFVDEF